MNIQTLQQALEDIEKAWQLDYIKIGRAHV